MALLEELWMREWLEWILIAMDILLRINFFCWDANEWRNEEKSLQKWGRSPRKEISEESFIDWLMDRRDEGGAMGWVKRWWWGDVKDWCCLVGVRKEDWCCLVGERKEDCGLVDEKAVGFDLIGEKAVWFGLVGETVEREMDCCE